MVDTKAQPEMVMGEEQVIAKITIKDIGCNPKKVNGLPDTERTLPLCRIYGKCNAVRVQVDSRKPDEPYTYFAGNFEAINLDGGEVYRSGKMFLPKGLSELMEAQVKAALAEDSSASITFGFEIQAVKSTNAIGYSFQAATLRKPEAEDELSNIRKLIKGLPASTRPKVLEGGSGAAHASQGAQRKSA